jgi:hypothetical protein
VLGATVWLVLAIGATLWLGMVLVFRRSLIGPRSVLRWATSAWLPRVALMACWGVAGWHIFCQRP